MLFRGKNGGCQCFPACRLLRRAAAAIGAVNPIAILSAESAKKNLRAHPELKLADYSRLPVLGSAPDLIIQIAEERIVLVRRGNEWHLAAIKAKRDHEIKRLLDE